MVEHLLYGVLDNQVLVDCQLWVYRLGNKHWQHPGRGKVKALVHQILVRITLVVMMRIGLQ